MAKNIQINIKKASNSYEVLNPSTTANQTFYSNTNTSSIITSTNVQGAIDQLFQSVSNGKSQIASAITDKGVSTSSTASFGKMANNIANIKSNTVSIISVTITNNSGVSSDWLVGKYVGYNNNVITFYDTSVGKNSKLVIGTSFTIGHNPMSGTPTRIKGTVSNSSVKVFNTIYYVYVYVPTTVTSDFTLTLTKYS